jgi:hypothetical protein
MPALIKDATNYWAAAIDAPALEARVSIRARPVRLADVRRRVSRQQERDSIDGSRIQIVRDDRIGG